MGKRVGSLRFGLHVADVAAHPSGADIVFRFDGGAYLFAGDAAQARRLARALDRAAEHADRSRRRTR